MPSPKENICAPDENACTAGYPIQDYVQPTFEMTPGFKPFTLMLLLLFCYISFLFSFIVYFSTDLFIT